MYAGDIRLGDTIDIQFTSRAFATGIPTTLAGTPVVSAYIDNSTTQLTAGITLTVDLDGVTGLNNIRIVASGGNGYTTSTNVSLIITTGTVGGVSVVGEQAGSFSIEKRSAVMPTTAARTLDISAGGEAGVDWANVGSPTTSNNLSATNIATTQKVDVDTIKTNPVVNAGTITFPTTATLASTTNITAGTITTVTTTTTATNLTNAPTNGDLTATMKASVTTAATAATPTAAAVTGSVGSIATGGIVATSFAAGAIDNTAIATNAIGSAQLSTSGVAEIAGAVWDITLASHVTAGSTGAALNAAGGAGDPWITALPGAYGAGTAGKIIGDNINAAISSRMATYTQPTGFLAATFPTGTVANTTNITAGTITTTTNLTNAPTSGDFTATMKASITTAATAATPTAAAVTGNVGGSVASVVGLTAADVGTIKSKTDNLPSDPADQSLIIDATNTLATLIDALPTNAELATALATADDAVLAAITALSSATVKKNTAFSDFEFPMKLTSDHWSAAIGKTVTGQRSLDGGAFASVTGTIAEVGNGVYQFDAAAADTNGNTVTWKFSNADCDDTIVTIKTSA